MKTNFFIITLLFMHATHANDVASSNNNSNKNTSAVYITVRPGSDQLNTQEQEKHELVKCLEMKLTKRGPALGCIITWLILCAAYPLAKYLISA